MWCGVVCVCGWGWDGGREGSGEQGERSHGGADGQGRRRAAWRAAESESQLARVLGAPVPVIAGGCASEAVAAAWGAPISLMRICSACILSTASFSRSLGPLNASPLSAPPAAAAAAAVAPAAALLLLDATKALYVAMRSTSCGWPVPPPPCASAESAILPSVTSQSTSSVGTSSSMTPARRALCLLTRSRVLPYSVLYERSGSSSPSERTITSRRSDRSINMMPSESGCESVIKSCVMTCAALTVSACFSCCLTSGTLLGRLVWWAAVAAAGADAGAAAAGAAASLSDAAGRFPPSAADCSCRAGSGGGARFWPVMSNFDISASRGSSGFMVL